MKKKMLCAIKGLGLGLITMLITVLMCGNAWAQGLKADAFLGYSRLGANTFVGNTHGLNGWHGALNVQVKPLMGIEGDLSHYGLGADKNVERTTLLLFGPRLTLGQSGIHLFAHGLVGGQHSANQTGASGGAMAVALGGGLDVRFAPYLSWRVADDYLTSTSSPSNAAHNRFSTGVVLRF